MLHETTLLACRLLHLSIVIGTFCTHRSPLSSLSSPNFPPYSGSLLSTQSLDKTQGSLCQHMPLSPSFPVSHPLYCFLTFESTHPVLSIPMVSAGSASVLSPWALIEPPLWPPVSLFQSPPYGPRGVILYPELTHPSPAYSPLMPPICSTNSTALSFMKTSSR